jgi:soluble P-type ATPase
LLGAPSVIGAGLPVGVAASVARHEAAGQRVLLLAATAAPLNGDRPPAGAEPAALLVLTEELRQEATQTVRYLAGQGVTIKVLSGDAPRAVAAFAERAGIPASGPPCDASGLTDEQMRDAIGTADVFGRVRPTQKLAAVKALQAAGHVVAMIGDGVNDVQALKQADLGIAMGSGSGASRSVARVVLPDGTFAAIPQLLDEARRVIVNIERVARLFVTKTVYAAIIAVSVGAAGIAYPFFSRHLTIVSTLTIGVPGFFLALAAGAPRARPGSPGGCWPSLSRRDLGCRGGAGCLRARSRGGRRQRASGPHRRDAGPARGRPVDPRPCRRPGGVADHSGRRHGCLPGAAVRHPAGAQYLRRAASARQRPPPGGRGDADGHRGTHPVALARMRRSAQPVSASRVTNE